MKKKAFFFLMDSIFAMVILTIGYFVVSSNKGVVNADLPLNVAVEGTIDILSSVEINEMCNSCNCSNAKLEELCIAGDVKNSDQTIMDFLGELYSTGNAACSKISVVWGAGHNGQARAGWKLRCRT